MPRPKRAVLDFSNGLVAPASPYTSRPHVRTLDNCWLSPDDYNAVEAMPGFARYTAGASPFETTNSIHVGIDETAFTTKVYASGTISGNIDLYEASTTAYTVRKANLTAALKLRSAQIQNHLVFCNGADSLFEIDLATDTVSDINLTRPSVTQASTSTTGFSGGKVKGVVKYAIAIVTGTTEGALSAFFGEIDCKDGNQVTIDLTHADFPGGTNYNIYRTLANGNQPFLLMHSVPGGVAYKDNRPDDGGGEYDPLVLLPYLHGDAPPAKLVTIIEQFGRLWGLAEDGELYWSDLINHRSWWTASDGNWIDVGRGDGDKGTALAKSPDGLYVFKDHHLYHVYTRDLDQIQVTPLTLAGAQHRGIGAMSQESVVNTRDGICFWYERNIYQMRGTEIRAIGDEISELLRNNTDTTGQTVALGYSSKYNHLLVSTKLTLPADGYTSVTFYYDFQRREWIGRHLYRFLGFVEILGSLGGLTLAVGGAGATDQDEDVHKLYDVSGTDSAGTAIPCRCEISELVGSSPGTDKLFDSVAIVAKREGSGSVVLEAIFQGDDTNSVNTTISLVKSGSTQDRIRDVVNLQERAREMALAITSTAASPQWKVFALLPEWQEYRQTGASA